MNESHFPPNYEKGVVKNPLKLESIGVVKNPLKLESVI